MTGSEDTILLVRKVNKSADPVKEACGIIGLMAGVIAFHKSDKAAAEFLREAASRLIADMGAGE